MMTIDDKIRDEKLQDHISIEAAKIDKYEYLTCEEYYLLIKVEF